MNGHSSSGFLYVKDFSHAAAMAPITVLPLLAFFTQVTDPAQFDWIAHRALAIAGRWCAIHSASSRIRALH
jgi:hypothetical protein